MPVRRDANGRIIDEPTRRIPASDHADPGAAHPRAVDITGPPVTAGVSPTGPPVVRPPVASRYSDTTTPVGHVPGDPERTVFFRPTAGPEDGGAAGDVMDDPPAGWLVVVEGPGKGNVATLGMGANSVGRDRSERVVLDHGDTKISRTNHGTITYDPLGHKFYLQHGGGKNLTYVGDEPVLAPRELAPLTHVRMGDTILRFVPLCGADFSWDDESGGE